ncbi:MAG TPA: 6-phosphogluconolactonase [Gammaproteobacteria bacterium]|nr:6-phosphogluconolactonase [Gammaproteobacteria bacterium]
MHTPHVHPDPETLARCLADRLIDHARQCIEARGAAHLVLAGGSTPRQLYRELAQPGRRDQLDWSRIHIYFGDERCVPPDHPDSNYHMARVALLEQVPIPEAQVHPIPARMETVRRDAAAYARELARHAPIGTGGQPRFDLVLLGLGEDGHTASLFPGTCILNERERAVAAVYVPRLKSWRISLTYPALRQARALWILTTGAAKADILGRIWREPDAGLPIQALADLDDLEWHLDAAAAEQIPL